MKAKEFFKCAGFTLLAFVVYPAMIIHITYQRWYYRNVILKETLRPVEDVEQKGDD
jgi:hypothetical protein